MIEEQTVFILGAGASWPYGLPTSTELRKQICLKFADRIKMLVRSRDQSKAEEMYQKAKEFAEAFYGSSDSIDLWLTNNQRFIPMGKHAIVTMILQGEHDGDFRERAPHPDNDWYTFLWQNMKEDYTQRYSYNSFSKNKIDFITFNYDRSLEQYLIECMKNRFYTHDISDDDIKKQIQSRRIIHVYGQIAPLDWQNCLDPLKYGTDPDNLWLEKYTKNIRIIEESKETQEVKDAIMLIQRAKRVFFLGFGFAQENLDLLQLPKALQIYTKIYGTAFGLRENEISSKRKIFSDALGTKIQNVNIHSMDNLVLLRQFL